MWVCTINSDFINFPTKKPEPVSLNLILKKFITSFFKGKFAVCLKYNSLWARPFFKQKRINSSNLR
jgi:hypothetical protein